MNTGGFTNAPYAVTRHARHANMGANVKSGHQSELDAKRKALGNASETAYKRILATQNAKQV